MGDIAARSEASQPADRLIEDGQRNGGKSLGLFPLTLTQKPAAASTSIPLLSFLYSPKTTLSLLKVKFAGRSLIPHKTSAAWR